MPATSTATMSSDSSPGGQSKPSPSSSSTGSPRDGGANSSPRSEAGKPARSRYYLAIVLVLLVASRSVDQVLFYRINFLYKYYVFYFSAVIGPLAFLAITIPVVVYKLACTESITPRMRSFPQWKFAVMGLLDCLFNIFSTFPVQHLGGSLANVLSQTVLPMNMGVAAVVMGTRYSKAHFLGVILVIYGVFVKLMPEIFGGGLSGGMGWMLLLVGSNVFAALSNVFKEKALKGVEMDEWWMNLWVSVWQLLFGALGFWQGYVRAFMDPMPPIGDCEDCTWGNYVQGANTCFLGGKVSIAGLSNATCTSEVSAPTFTDGQCHLDCSAGSVAPVVLFLAYIVFNITYNFLMLHVFKLGSSVLFVVANAVRLPVVDLLLMWKWLAGPSYQPFTRYDGYALFALCLGTVVYYSEKEDPPPDDASGAAKDVEEGLPMYEALAPERRNFAESPLQGDARAAPPRQPSYDELLRGGGGSGSPLSWDGTCSLSDPLFLS